MRDLMKALSDLENQLITTYGITLNEAMVLCSVGNDTVSAGDITTSTGMTPSHASKTIRSVESKERPAHPQAGRTRQTPDVFRADRERERVLGGDKGEGGGGAGVVERGVWVISVSNGILF